MAVWHLAAATVCGRRDVISTAITPDRDIRQQFDRQRRIAALSSSTASAHRENGCQCPHLVN
jgi:hypothetical protein